MIINFRLYEALNVSYRPEIGDYVLCEENGSDFKSFSKTIFINNNIGKIIRYESKSIFPYVIYYENAPILMFSYNEREMELKEIKYPSKNKEDLEAILDAKKYNL